MLRDDGGLRRMREWETRRETTKLRRSAVVPFSYLYHNLETETMILLLLLILLTIPLLAFPQKNGDFKCMTISKDDFYSDMKLKPEIKIIDVRSKSEFIAERIEGAVNIPVSKLSCRKAEKLSRETVIYFYCRSGVRSCTAESKFNDMGFKHIFSLENGINDWKKAGFPVLTGRKGVIKPQFIPLAPYPPIAAPAHH